MNIPLTDVREYFLPTRASEVLRLIRREKGRCFLLAGGTGLTFGAPSASAGATALLRKRKGVEVIIDLSHAGLNYVRETSGGISIGAATPVGELLKNPLFSSYAGGMVRESALSIATTPLRNLITAGGNVMQVFIWSSLPVLFLALDARFRVMGERNGLIRAVEFFSAQPRRLVGAGSILKEIILPAPSECAGGAFMKFSKTETDFALINVAVLLSVKGGVCNKARIAIGAVSPMPVRLLAAEKILEGQPLRDELIEDAARAGAGGIFILRDIRVSEGYKRDIIPVILRRCLKIASERASGDH
jgi:carbon-monoxide dehydrogenase medium subunit